VNRSTIVRRSHSVTSVRGARRGTGPHGCVRCQASSSGGYRRLSVLRPGALGMAVRPSEEAGTVVGA
jgi:hypothetical protein